jgi:hypothetical protein
MPGFYTAGTETYPFFLTFLIQLFITYETDS